MTYYLDAAVIVPMLIDERSSAAVVEWLEGNSDFAVGDLSSGEVVSALHRAVREGRETRDAVEERIGLFDEWRARDCLAVSHAPADIRAAADHVRRFDLALRMPDAIHLATCARLGLTLATRDRRLLRAAELLGIAAVRPG